MSVRFCEANNGHLAAASGARPLRSSIICPSSRRNDPVITSLKLIVKKLGPRIRAAEESSTEEKANKIQGEGYLDDWRSPVYMLNIVNVLVYLIINGLHVPSTGQLFMSFGSEFHLWQLFTSGFVHSSPTQLAGTTFLNYTFGRLVERFYGGWGVVLTYITSVLGANLFALWILPAKAAGPIATSSAASLGLFIAGLFWPRLQRKPLEVLCLTPFVFICVSGSFTSLASSLVVDGVRVGQLVHVLGAVLGASFMPAVFKGVDAVRQRLEELERQEKRRSREEERKRRAQEPPNEDAWMQMLGSAAKAATDAARKL